MNTFQYSYEVVNFCEDRYNPESVRKMSPENFLVHSKSSFLSNKTKRICEIYEKEFSREPTFTELQKMLPLIHQGYEYEDIVPHSAQNLSAKLFQAVCIIPHTHICR